MTSPPRISVLLPARNAASTLETALASISRQTERAWECVIVDDGSSDGTAAIADQAAARDPRFRVLHTSPCGLIPALNTGLRACRAAVVARMDADDVMHRDRLAAQAEKLDADPGLAAVGCHVRLFPRSSVTPRLRDYEGWLNAVRSDTDVARERFIECPVAHPSLMMRRRMASLGYEDRGWPEDYDLILRALGSGSRIGMVPRRLLGWRNGPSTLSRTDARYALDRFTACKAHYLAAGFLSGSSRYILWGYGSTGRLLMKALAAHGKSPTHIVEVKAGRIGQRIHGALVIPPAALRDHRGLPVVVSVARDGPRTEIRQAMDGISLVEGADYVCTA